MEGDTVTISEAAQLLRVNESTVRRQIAMGILPAERVASEPGEVYVIPRAVLSEDSAAYPVAEALQRLEDSLGGNSGNLEENLEALLPVVLLLARRVRNSEEQVRFLKAKITEEREGREEAERRVSELNELLEAAEEHLDSTQEQLAGLSKQLSMRRLPAKKRESWLPGVPANEPLFSEIISEVDVYSGDPTAVIPENGQWQQPRVVVTPSAIALETPKGIELRVPIGEISGIESSEYNRGLLKRTERHAVKVTRGMQISIFYICDQAEQRDRLYWCLTSIAT